MSELTDGLGRLRAAWLSKGMPHTNWLRPGMSPQQVHDRLGAADLPVPHEIVDWYSWHNGSVRARTDGVDGRTAGFHPWFSLDESLTERTDQLEWAESEREAGMLDQPEYAPRFDDNCLPILNLPVTYGILAPDSALVRVVSSTSGADPEEGKQLQSLAELVDVWTRIIEAYCTWDKDAGRWAYDYEQFPLELRRRSIL